MGSIELSNFVDVHYVNLLSGRLDKFARKKEDLYNFRCPYCGDSQKHKNKARGYFFRVKTDMVYKCHNCGVGRTLPNFLKDNAPTFMMNTSWRDIRMEARAKDRLFLNLNSMIFLNRSSRKR